MLLNTKVLGKNLNLILSLSKECEKFAIPQLHKHKSVVCFPLAIATKLLPQQPSPPPIQHFLQNPTTLKHIHPPPKPRHTPAPQAPNDRTKSHTATQAARKPFLPALQSAAAIAPTKCRVPVRRSRDSLRGRRSSCVSRWTRTMWFRGRCCWGALGRRRRRTYPGGG